LGVEAIFEGVDWDAFVDVDDGEGLVTFNLHH
jgi:hypothetical protein